jgi:hypothetical protein
VLLRPALALWRCVASALAVFQRAHEGHRREYLSGPQLVRIVPKPVLICAAFNLRSQRKTISNYVEINPKSQRKNLPVIWGEIRFNLIGRF